MSIQAIGYTFGPALPTEPFGPRMYQHGGALKLNNGLTADTESLIDWNKPQGGSRVIGYDPQTGEPILVPTDEAFPDINSSEYYY